jgi:uncharacterized protein YjdB
MVSPTTGTLTAGQTLQISATVTGASNQQVSWSVSPAGVGGVSAAGLYTAPAAITTQQTVTVTATSAAQSTVSASATITLNPTVGVTVSPTTGTLTAGQTLQLSATVTGTSNQQVSWSVSPAGVGGVSAAGLYTAPAAITTQQTVTVTATSAAQSTVSASATITLSVVNIAPASTYSYERALTIAHGQVANSDQNDLAVLVEGVYPYLATAANGGHVQSPNGYDIIFTSDAAGLHPLNWEIERYNAATGSVVFWVRVPTISHTADTVIYMFYGNSNVTAFQGNKCATWDGNYLAAYHMGDDLANTIVGDSTSNANSGTSQATTASRTVNGEIGSGLSFNGANDYIYSGSVNVTGTMTLEGWVNLAAWPNDGYGGYLGSKGKEYFIEFTTDNSGAHGIVTGTYINGTFFAGTAVAVVSSLTGKFHHFAATWDGTYWNLFVDGVLAAQTAGSGPSVSSEPFTIGAQTFSGGIPFQFLDGAIDEVRVSTSARSPNWIQTEYNNQSSPTTFYSIGAEQAVGAPSVSVAVSPTTGTLTAGQTLQISATVAGSSNQQASWSVSPAGVGSVSAAGLYTAPAAVTTQQTVTVTATSAADATKSACATITLNPTVGVAVNPTTGTLTAGQTLQISATVAGSSNQQVSWSVSPAGVGSVSAAGLYTAPAAVTTQQTVTVTATSAADATKSACATITLNPTVGVAVNPTTGTLTAGQTLQISATVTGSSNQQVSWSVSPAGMGSVSAAGLYTAPAAVTTQQTVTVTATSAALSTASASATITLSPTSTQATCGPPSLNAWTGCYYENTSFGSLGFTRVDPYIQFSWPSSAAIGPGVGPQNFSVRWQGDFLFGYNWYDFFITTSDEVRIYVDNQLIFDAATQNSTSPYRVPYLMSAGVHLIEVDYVHNTGTAAIDVAWNTAQ